MKKGILFSLLLLLISNLALAQKQEPRLVLPIGHTDLISKYVFTNDNKYIITQSKDHTVRIWDAITGIELRVLEGVKSTGGLQAFQCRYKYGMISTLNSHLASFDYAPKSNKVVSSFGDNTVQLSDFETSKIEKVFKGHDLPISHVVFSKDEKYIATASLDSTIIVWDVQSGKEIAKLFGHKNWVNSVEFSSDNKKLLSASYDGTVIIWDIQSADKLQIIDNEYGLELAKFSNDNKYIFFQTVKGSSLTVFELVSEKSIYKYLVTEDKDHQFILNSEFINQDNNILLNLNKGNVRIINLTTNKIIKEFFGVSNAVMSNDNNFLALSRSDSLCIYDAKTWQVRESVIPSIIKKLVFSPDSKRLVVDFYKNTFIWDIEKNVKICAIGKGNSKHVDNLKILSNNQVVHTTRDIAHDEGNIVKSVNQKWNLESGKNIEFKKGKFDNFKKTDQGILFTFSKDSIYFYDGESGRFIQKFKNYARNYNSETGKTDYYFSYEDSASNVDQSIFNDAVFSNDLKWMFTIEDSNIRVWDVLESKSKYLLRGHLGHVNTLSFSNDNSYLVSSGTSTFNGENWIPDTTIRVWDFKNGKQIAEIIGKGKDFFISISKDSRYILAYSNYTEGNSDISIWDYELKKEIRVLKGHKYGISDFIFSHDNSYIVTLGRDSTIRKWNFNTGECFKVVEYKDRMYNLKIHPKFNEYYFNDSYSNKLTSVNFEEPKTLKKFEGHTGEIMSEVFFNEGKNLLTSSNDHKTILWDVATGKPIYTRLQLEGDDWLVYDTNYRFDGTPGAIEKLYFVCGLEVVELNQVKDSLYVPNLVQRIMNGENLDHLPKLSELNICGVTPVVEPLENDKSGNQGYRIIPRSGGVGDVDVYINGVVRLSTNAKKLKRKDGNYMLYVEKELLELYQIPGEELKVKVIAKTANNSVSSRGVVIDIESDEKTTFKKSSLHAIMIGVDDYKGDGLDLNYAAKDANDLQVVLQKSAQKFFNIDDTSRVHFYNLTVNRLGANGNEKIKGITPDRTNIINTIAEIEKTSKPEDILLLFFAGHGEIVDKDQLLLLTSESSREDFKGLRMRELLELLNKVPAGKRVLILDACHSGAAINNLDMAQLTGKRDVKDAERQSQRLKELDKLASKSGFAIITASSSDQKALELPQYEHGLMTYALLNSMLNNKNALDEDNKLQLEKWLMATEEEVRKLNANQSAERMVPINFTLGKVDDEVRSSIVLKEIPTIFLNNVFNSELIYDDLNIKAKLNEYFASRARGGDKSLLLANQELNNAAQVNIQYTKTKNSLQVKVIILKNNQVHKQFTKTGTEAQLNDLIKEIALEIEGGVK
jgi:WD40 repeat protein